MKKIILSLLAGVFLAIGAAPSKLAAAGAELTAVGERDASGARTGDYKVVDGTGNTRAQGRFDKGKLEGKWSFFDTHQVKVAEISYQGGVPSGPYRTYFGSRANPAAAGKLESEGEIVNGALFGHHIAYSPDGKVTRRTFFEGGVGPQAGPGPDETVVSKGGTNDVAKLDLQFIHAMDEFIRPAFR